MAELNKISCTDESGNNTGIPDCFVNPKYIMGIILTPPTFKIAAADMADLLTALQTATMAGAGARIYPLINFVALSADNSQAPTKESFGYGASIVIKDGDYDMTFQYVDGGLCLHKQLRTFNSKKWGVFFVDADGIIYGYKNGNDLQAIPLNQFYAEKWKVSDGSKSAQFLVDVSFKSQYLNEFVGFIATADEFDIATTVTGLINLIVKEVTALATGTVKVQINTSCGGANLYDTFKSALSLVGAWSASNAATGSAITITTVTANDTDKSFSLAFNTTAGYPSTGGKINLSLAAPAALAALASPMVGYESNVLVETV